MKSIVKICVIFFIMTLACHLGKAQSLTARKKISVQILCTEIKWTEHTLKSCSAVHITVESLDNAEFEFTNLTFAKEITKFLDPQSLDATCFENGFQNIGSTHFNNSEIDFTSSSSRQEGGFIYDVKCSRIRINRYDTKLENMGPNGCKVKPLGADDDCRSQNLQVLVEVEAQLQKYNETNFDVPFNNYRRSISDYMVTNCIITPGFNDTQFQFNFTEKSCNNSNEFPPPTRGLNFIWNLYAWQMCSKLAFGEKVLHLDGRFDRWVLNNLTGLCGTNLPKMDSCLKENALSKTPSLENFNFYSNLKKSYDDMCANQIDFSEGHKCFRIIQSDKEMKTAYVSKVQQCSSVFSSDACMDYSKNVLCMAFAQYKVYSNCTTFQVTYKYKRIIEDRNNARGNCSSSQINPCSPKDPKYNDICSSGSQIEISFLILMLFCLASWMNLSN